MAKLTAIIMAAGMGTRMGELTKSTPKPLLLINNKPIIEYGINFVKQIGVDEIIIVGGYQHDLLDETVKSKDPTIKVIKNSSYELGNIFSLKAGLDEISSGSFLLYHADHIYRSELAKKIRNQLKDEIVLFTDNDRNLTDDDMKVKVAEGDKLKTVSKRISDFELGYVGITYCPEGHFEYYRNTLSQVIADRGEQAVSEDVMQYIADKDEVSIKIGDISGSQWHEVDNEEDYETVVKYIASATHHYV